MGQQRKNSGRQSIQDAARPEHRLEVKVKTLPN